MVCYVMYQRGITINKNNLKISDVTWKTYINFQFLTLQEVCAILFMTIRYKPDKY